MMGASFLALMSCVDKKANANNLTEVESAAKTVANEIEKTSSTTIDGVSQFVCWDLGMMNVTKKGNNFVIDTNTGPLKLILKPMGEGVYQEISDTQEMMGQGARFVAQKVGDVTTLTAYHDQMVLFTLLSCDDLKAYRNQCYRRMLTSKFEPTDEGVVTITDDMMRGPILPDSPDLHYFFVEDDNGDLTEYIRLSPGRFHLAFSPADKGVNLHTCNMYGETGELQVNYDRENSIILRYAEDPGWPWLSTDVLDAGFLIYNFDTPYWKLMLNKLKAIKNPNEVEIWNRRLLENLIKYNEPYTGLASTDY